MRSRPVPAAVAARLAACELARHPAEEALLPPVLGFLPTRELLRLALASRQQLSAVLTCEDVWCERVEDDFGGNLERARCWAQRSEGSARELHRRLAELRRAFRDAVVIVQGDLCTVPRTASRTVDAIVCPAVPSCGPYGPCAVAVHRAAGPALDTYLQTTALPAVGGRVRVGQAIATPSFELEGVHTIVHAVGPTWQFDEEDQRRLLRQAYESACRALEASPAGPVRCAATASISTGGNGMSPEVAAPIALAVLRDAVCFGSLECIYVVTLERSFRGKFEEIRRTMLERFNEDPSVPDDANSSDGLSGGEWESE
uniref:Macro domain-containing protein n=1 Tax=Alexandrium andersonii TaxID=327968 RepID=A0A7S2F1X8_9DINO